VLADYWVLQELSQVPKLLSDPGLDLFLKKCKTLLIQVYGIFFKIKTPRLGGQV
jgi:hypothetical protein